MNYNFGDLADVCRCDARRATTDRQRKGRYGRLEGRMGGQTGETGWQTLPLHCESHSTRAASFVETERERHGLADAFEVDDHCLN